MARRQLVVRSAVHFTGQAGWKSFSKSVEKRTR